MFTAATVEVAPGSTNPLIEAAQSIGEPGGSDTKAKADKPRENQNGSFERFMSSFGSPHRWAGA